MKKASAHPHHSAPTRHVQAKGIRFAYRRFGKAAGVPLVFNLHFMGDMDSWDPAVTDGLACGREVILFDNAGVGGSSGEVPPTFAEMATSAAAFIDVLRLTRVDVLGFSIGSMVAQNIVLQRPELVRKLILIGSSPRNGDGMPFTPESQPIFGRKYENHQYWLDGIFGQSETSRSAGRAFLKRRDAHIVNRDIPANEKVAPAQIAAIEEWSKPVGERLAYLQDIKLPVLVVNGTRDIIYYTSNSFLRVQHLPNAQLIIYPGSAHAAPFQYPELLVEHATMFLR